MTLNFVVPSGSHRKPVRLVKYNMPDNKVCPRHVIPVYSMDQCVCCPTPVEHGPICSIRYRFSRINENGSADYVRDL